LENKTQNLYITRDFSISEFLFGICFIGTKCTLTNLPIYVQGWSEQLNVYNLVNTSRCNLTWAKQIIYN